MSFAVTVSGSASSEFEASANAQSGCPAWNQEMGAVKALTRKFVDDLKALGLNVSSAKVNGFPVPPDAPTTST